MFFCGIFLCNLCLAFIQLCSVLCSQYLTSTLFLAFDSQFAKLQKLKSDQEHLPIYQFKDAIVEHVKSNQVVIVAGDTGCGKSTQVKYLKSLTHYLGARTPPNE